MPPRCRVKLRACSSATPCQPTVPPITLARYTHPLSRTSSNTREARRLPSRAPAYSAGAAVNGTPFPISFPQRRIRLFHGRSGNPAPVSKPVWAVPSIEGSNPSLSAEVGRFLSTSWGIRPFPSRCIEAPRWVNAGQRGPLCMARRSPRRSPQFSPAGACALCASRARDPSAIVLRGSRNGVRLAGGARCAMPHTVVS
jgi:hypothetical protein